jgi:hypothetical protein
MHRATKRLGEIVVCVAVVVLAPACHYYYKTPAPQHFTNVDSIPFDSIRAYAHTLQFDTVTYTADVRRVKFDSTGKSKVDELGDSARIEPEIGAWNLTVTELARGRIIARIRTDSVHSANGYGPWWTWWWVDKHGAPGDTSWRSVLLPDGLKTLIHGGLEFRDHSPYEWHQSIARWGSQWSTCSISGCCMKQ